MKQDSLTVLDYIRTSIEILMHLKNDDDRDISKEGGRSYRLARDADGGAASDFTSTFQSIDFPPKEYEMQLQSSEAEVRNHIKVEQQLKLHIEVLQEKIDDLEKEREKQKIVKSEERRSIENRLRDEY
jgi:DNA-binding transcriptional MerR regulator